MCFLSLYLIPISHNLIITGHIISPSGYHTTFALWPRRTNATYENKTSHPKHQRWHKHGKKITSHTTNNPGYNTQGCGGGSNGSRNRRNTPSRLGGCQVTEAAGVCVTRALCHSDDDALPDTTMRPRSHGTHVCVRVQVSCMLHLSCHQTGTLRPT